MVVKGRVLSMTVEKFILNKGLSDLETRVCGRQECVAGHAYGPATRDYYLLHFVVSGKGCFTTERGTYTVGTDQMFIIHPDEVTYYRADEREPWDYIWIGFSANCSLPAKLMQNDVMSVPELRELFFACVNEPDSLHGGVGYESFLCARLWEIMRALELRSESQPMHDCALSYARGAVAIMESEYGSEITVADIARRLHLNRSYLSVVFREHTGRSPSRYLLDIRMRRAAELLCRQAYNVSVTALSVGFLDVFSFSRAFKRYYGVAPREYAREHTEG